MSTNADTWQRWLAERDERIAELELKVRELEAELDTIRRSDPSAEHGTRN